MKKSFSSLCLIACFTMACSKSDKTETPVPASPILGFWTGDYSTTGFIGKSNYAILVKEGGVARVYDLDNKTDTSGILSKADAVWTLAGSTFSVSYKSGSKNVLTKTTVNAGFTEMTGTWAFEAVVKGNVNLKK